MAMMPRMDVMTGATSLPPKERHTFASSSSDRNLSRVTEVRGPPTLETGLAGRMKRSD